MPTVRSAAGRVSRTCAQGLPVHTSRLPFFYKKLKNVSCEYDRLNDWNSTLQAAWYIRHVRIIWFLWTKRTILLLIQKNIWVLTKSSISQLTFFHFLIRTLNVFNIMAYNTYVTRNPPTKLSCTARCFSDHSSITEQLQQLGYSSVPLPGTSQLLLGHVYPRVVVGIFSAVKLPPWWAVPVTWRFTAIFW